MKKVVVLTMALTGILFAGAQSIKPIAGKKMQVVLNSKNIMSVESPDGENMDLETVSIITNEYGITAVTEKGYSLKTTLLRVQGLSKVQEIERKFDSETETDQSDSVVREAFKMVGKSTEIKIEDHRASLVSGELMNSLPQVGLKDATAEFVKFILYKDDLNTFRTGYHWTDSLQTEAMKLSAESEVTAMTETMIEVTVKTKANINTTMQQMGINVKTVFTTTIDSKRYYDRSTGIMISEEGDSLTEGTAEGMSMQIPMKVKTHIKMTVK